jgi:hypothetical protein
MNLRRFASAPRRFRSTPYLAMAAIYCTMFVFAFSSMGNFGILARQRVQMLPFLFVFMALPIEAPRREDPRDRLLVGAGMAPATAHALRYGRAASDHVGSDPVGHDDGVAIGDTVSGLD